MHHRLPTLFLLTALVAALLPGCTKGENEASAESKQRSFDVENVIVIDAASAKQGPFTVSGAYAGEFIAEPRAELAPDVQGRVVDIEADVGDRVEAGDTLAKLDKRTYTQSVRELGAAVDMAKAQVESAKVRLANAEDELRRKEPLSKKKIVSALEVAALKSNVAAAKQEVAVAKASVQQNRARLSSAREDLKETTLTAPFAGRIARRYVDPGTQVGPGTPVFRLIGDEAMFLRIDVPEADAARVRPESPVAIRVDALGGKRIDGTVRRIAPALDPKTRTLQVDLAVQAPDADTADAPTLRVGMYARAEIILGERDKTLHVPNQAIRRTKSGTPYIWTVVDGRAKKIDVTLGLEGRTRSEIVSGLSAGQQVVVRGHDKLEPDAKVKLVSAGE